MKFLLVTLEYFPFKGGVANYYTNLVYHWPKSSEITVLDNKNNNLLRKNGPLKWLPAVLTIWKEIRKNKINHILVGQILPIGTASFILSLVLNIRYTVFLHGLDLSSASKNRWKKFLTKKIIKKSDNIICANSFVCEILKNNYKVNNKKIIVVNPGVNNFNFDSKDKKNELIKKYDLFNKKIIFSLGRLVKRKGFDYTILSLKKVFELDNGMDLKYVISGVGPDEKYLKDLAVKTFGENFKEKIVFTGEISEEEKWTFLSLSDIFIMPARNIAGDYEGFGIVFLEAGLLSKPVIAGKSGGISDAVVNNVNGLMVDPESQEDIAEAILKLLKNPNLSKSLGDSGRERAVNKFNWLKQSNEIYEFLNK